MKRRKLVAPIGKRFNKGIVIGQANKGTGGRFRVKVQCDCGGEFECELRHLERGVQKSCGCHRSSQNGLDKHPLANVWRNMKRRCANRKDSAYPRYGGRGIKVCREWHDLKKFVTWAENNGYRKGLEIDRIDNDKGYSPENCRWTTSKEQGRNKRNNRIVKYKEAEYCIAELAEEIKMPYHRLYQRIHKLGWSVEKAVSQ